MKKAPSTLARNSSSDRKITASHGSAFPRTFPPTIRKSKSRRSPAASPWTTRPRRCIRSIYSICESPKNGQLIWAGTDDGNLQITRDGGKHWTNVVDNVAGLGKTQWVSYGEASRFDEGTAYATFDRHTSAT